MSDYPLPLFDEDLEKSGTPDNAKKLKELFVTETTLSDKSAQVFIPMKDHLETLVIHKTRISREMVRVLRVIRASILTPKPAIIQTKVLTKSCQLFKSLHRQIWKRFMAATN